jgi:hypothetical protein
MLGVKGPLRNQSTQSREEVALMHCIFEFLED